MRAAIRCRRTQRWRSALLIGILSVPLAMFAALLHDSQLPTASLSHRDDLLGRRGADDFQARNERFLRLITTRFLPTIYRGHSQLDVEYARSLSHVVAALDADDVIQVDPIGKHAPTLNALPDYARIELFVPDSAVDRVGRRIVELGLASRTRVISYAGRLGEGAVSTRWMRDAFVESRSGKLRILNVAPAYRNGTDLRRSDLAFVQQLAAQGLRVVPWPLFVSGGNLELGRGRGRVLFVGAGELSVNDNALAVTVSRRPSRAGVLGILRQWSGADRVVVLPNSQALFHLDMVMMMLGDGVAAVIAPVDPQNLLPEDAAVIAETVRQLRANGFRVVGIPTTADFIRQFRSPVNGLIYTDPESGARAALLPAFPSVTSDSGDEMTKLVEAAYRAAGVTPSFVVDLFSSYHGNTHCAIAVIE